jgi:hypothetical protein
MTFTIPHTPLWMKKCLLTGGLLAALVPMGAVERTLKIEVPASVGAGKDISVMLSASTDAGKGEQVGFLQVEVSMDEGKTWTAVCYLQKSGPRVAQQATLKAGAAGSTVKLRARAAFRDGLAGDVDYSGAAIRWDGSWNNWQTPPAKQVSVAVTAR